MLDKLPADIAVFWVIIAVGALAIGAIIFMIRRGLFGDETHLDKMKGG